MARNHTVHRCTECGHAQPQWAGRCPACGEWSTLVEEVELPAAAAAAPRQPGETPVPIDQVDAVDWVPLPTGNAEVDHVLGGGIVPGSVTLIGGEPGVGKSTLLLQIVGSIAAARRRVLYVSAEESKQQVRLRAERLGVLEPDLWLVSETDLANILAAIDDVKPDVVVVDSIQTIAHPELSSAPGTVAQVRDCTHRLISVAKSRGMSVVLVGHVTKEGALAGPRTLEHMVDTVLAFEGDRHHALRVLRGIKHRFGPAGELGVFEMVDDGLRAVPDPSTLFLSDRTTGVSGSIVVPVVDGHRALLVEVQALVTQSYLASPKRSGEGLDAGRLALLAAVMNSRARVSLANKDVYGLAVGGVQVREPAADLAMCLAMASAARNEVLPNDLVAIGEVGLGGEIRSVGHLERRVNEAARLGLRRALVPRSAPALPVGVEAIRVATLLDAFRVAFGDDHD
jgi:DNA repair protein RadA/Sms